MTINGLPAWLLLVAWALSLAACSAWWWARLRLEQMTTRVASRWAVELKEFIDQELVRDNKMADFMLSHPGTLIGEARGPTGNSGTSGPIEVG